LSVFTPPRSSPLLPGGLRHRSRTPDSGPGARTSRDDRETADLLESAPFPPVARAQRLRLQKCPVRGRASVMEEPASLAIPSARHLHRGGDRACADPLSLLIAAAAWPPAIRHSMPPKARGLILTPGDCCNLDRFLRCGKHPKSLKRLIFMSLEARNHAVTGSGCGQGQGFSELVHMGSSPRGSNGGLMAMQGLPAEAGRQSVILPCDCGQGCE
jgi:hypothetical protein